MNSSLIITTLFLMILTGLIAYVTAIAWRYRPARFFVLFLTNLTLLILFSIARQLSSDASFLILFENLFILSVGTFSLFLIWMLGQLFVPEWWHGRQAIIWISAPYVLVLVLVALDLFGRLGLFFSDYIISNSDIHISLVRPRGIVLLALLGASFLPPLALLVVSFIRQPFARVPIAFLFGAVLLTVVLGFTLQSLAGEANAGFVMVVPILSALTYVVLQSRLVIPTDIALEQALRESADLIIVIDRDGAIAYANTQAAAQGFAPDLPFTTQFVQAIAADDALRTTIAETISGAGSIEFFAGLAGKRLRFLLAPVSDAHGQQRGTLLVGRDITELEQRANDLTTRNAEQQRLLELVSTLETPSVTVAEGVLLAPIVGALDSRRAEALTRRLLNDVHEQRTHQVILDVSGVPAVDRTVAEALIATARAVQLLGCQVVLSGISPSMAQTLVEQTIMLNNLMIVRSPQDVLGQSR
jgi:rsbT co-antagonist protein RsbR